MVACAPRLVRSSPVRFFGVAFVLTGMKNGVGMFPVFVCNIPVLAVPCWWVMVK